jgi:hypothetical protein
MTDDDLETLRQQTERGDRVDEAGDQEARRELKESILDELEKIDAGEEQKTISIWDGPIAALVRALEDEHHELLEEIGEDLADEMDIDADEIKRALVLRLALGLGLREVAPDAFESMRDAVKEQAVKGL